MAPGREFNADVRLEQMFDWTDLRFFEDFCRTRLPACERIKWEIADEDGKAWGSSVDEVEQAVEGREFSSATCWVSDENDYVVAMLVTYDRPRTTVYFYGPVDTEVHGLAHVFRAQWERRQRGTTPAESAKVHNGPALAMRWASEPEFTMHWGPATDDELVATAEGDESWTHRMLRHPYVVGVAASLTAAGIISAVAVARGWIF